MSWQLSRNLNKMKEGRDKRKMEGRKRRKKEVIYTGFSLGGTDK